MICKIFLFYIFGVKNHLYWFNFFIAVFLSLYSYTQTYTETKTNICVSCCVGSIQILFPSNTSTGSGRHISLHMRIVLKSSKFNIFFNEGCAVHQVVWYRFHLSDVATPLCFQIITKDKKYELLIRFS